MPPEVTVLRIGHRPQRDKRITTHVCLTARAFGARRAILTTRDAAVERSVAGVVKRFGGDFALEHSPSWRAAAKAFDGPLVHLTMYGEPHTDVLPRVAHAQRVMVAVGAEKVPPELYQIATHNCSVGNQPHSEVAALAVVLEGLMGPGELYRDRASAQVRIEPTARGKRVRGSAARGP